MSIDWPSVHWGYVALLSAFSQRSLRTWLHSVTAWLVRFVSFAIRCDLCRCDVLSARHLPADIEIERCAGSAPRADVNATLMIRARAVPCPRASKIDTR